MQIVKIVLWIVLVTGVQAKDIKWQELENIYKYSASNFHLKDDVSVMEIRRYDTYDNYKKYTKPTIEMKYYKTPLKLLDARLVKRFKSATPNLSKNGNIHRTSNTSPEISNAFVINNDGSILKMNEIADVVGYMGEIDTPAEAQLILWLHGKREGTKYHKTSKGYEVMIEYEWVGPAKERTGAGGIAEFCYKVGKARDRAIINKKGKIVSYRQMWRSKKSSLSCIHADPPVLGDN